MSGGSKATRSHVPSFHLDDEDVHSSGNDPMMEDWIGSLERELSAHLSGEEMEGEEGEGEGEGEVDEEEDDGEEEDGEKEDGEEVDKGGEGEAMAPSSSSNDYRPFILPSIWLINDFLS